MCGQFEAALYSRARSNSSRSINFTVRVFIRTSFAIAETRPNKSCDFLDDLKREPSPKKMGGIIFFWTRLEYFAIGEPRQISTDFLGRSRFVLFPQSLFFAQLLTSSTLSTSFR